MVVDIGVAVNAVEITAVGELPLSDERKPPRFTVCKEALEEVTI